MAGAEQHFLGAWNIHCGHVRLEQHHTVSGARIPLAYAPAKLAIDIDANPSASPLLRRQARARRRLWNAAGWQVITLTHEEIVTDVDRCVADVQGAIEAILDGRASRWEIVNGPRDGRDTESDRDVETSGAPAEPSAPRTTESGAAQAPSGTSLGTAIVDGVVQVVMTPIAVVIGVITALITALVRLATVVLIGLGTVAVGAAGVLVVILLILGLSVWGLGRFLAWATPPAAPASAQSLPPDALLATPIERAVASGTAGPGHVQVMSAGLNVRSEPRPEASIVTVVYAGDELTVIGRSEDGQWMHIEISPATTSASTTGWVAARFVSPLP